MKNKFRIEIDPQTLVPQTSVRGYYLVSVAIVSLMGVVIALSYQKLPQVVPILFTEPWGEARLLPKLYLVMLPIIGVITGVINVIVSRGIGSEQKLLIRTLAVGVVAVNVMLLTSLAGIIQSLI